MSGDDAGLLAGEQRSGAAQAGHHLVGDEQHAVALRRSASFRASTCGGIDQHAARAQNQRLDDQGGRALRRQAFERVAAFPARALPPEMAGALTSNSSGS